MNCTVHFYKPKRIRDRVLCWLLGQTYCHVNIEIADGSGYLFDCPKSGEAKAYQAQDFLTERPPALSLDYSSSYSPEEIGAAMVLFRTVKVDRWGTWLWLLRGWHQRDGLPPWNCTTAISLFYPLGRIGGDGTPDELLRSIIRERQETRTGLSPDSKRVDSILKAMGNPLFARAWRHYYSRTSPSSPCQVQGADGNSGQTNCPLRLSAE